MGGGVVSIICLDIPSLDTALAFCSSSSYSTIPCPASSLCFFIAVEIPLSFDFFHE